MNSIFHSVLILTYNHSKYIRSSLDSVLNQSQLPDEIIVLDDHSTDDNWQIISEYSKNHPGFIKCYRNEKNIGLLEGLKKIRQLHQGNVVSFVAGDDMLGKDAIKGVNNGIIINKLDPVNDKFIIVTNSLHLYPNGSTTLWNNYKERNIPAFKTRLRYGLSYRGVGFSIQLLKAVTVEADIHKKHPEVSYSADFIKGFEEILNAEKLVYVDVIGGIYRLNVGVTANQVEKIKWSSHLAVYNLVYKKYHHMFDSSDIKFVKFIKSADTLKINPSFRNWIRTLYYWILNIGNFSYNNPAIRNIHYLFPSVISQRLKNSLYPLFLKSRRN
jgi:glycosyltransferase involved in cell wall biosynthesis